MSFNIAIDSRTINHNEKSGLWVYTESLIKSLSDMDKENNYRLLFSGLKIFPEDISLNLSPNFRKEILPIPDRAFWGKDFLWNNILLPRFVKKNRIDIFHMPAGHDLPSLKSAKTVITVHDLRSLHIDDVMPQNLRGIKTSCRMADTVITVSEHTRMDVINSFGIPGKKVKRIYLGIEDNLRKITDEKLTGKFKLGHKLTKPFFFSLGLMPRKNIKRLISAFDRFKYKSDFLLVLAGPGAHGKHYKEYRDMIKEKRLQNSILLLGALPQKDLSLFYSCAFAFVFPSLYEGFGIPALEAMSYECPVIASNTAALPEIAGDAALFIDPLDITDIANSMERMVDYKSLRQELVEKGRNRIKNFTMHSMAKQVLDAYSSTLTL